MGVLKRDLSYVLRQLGRSPAFTIATVLTLALGIGANTAIFSMVRGVLLRPLPYSHSDRFVHLRYGNPSLDDDSVRFSAPEIHDYVAQNHTFSGLMEYHSMAFTLLGRGEPDRVQTGVISANGFDVMGVRPILGRGFRPDDEQLGAPPVLVLSYDYWRRHIGGDPGIVGQTLRMNDRPITVVGVLPPLPAFPGQDDVFMTISSCPARSSPEMISTRSARMMKIFGRLRPGVSLDQAKVDLSTIASRLRKEFPQDYPDDAANRFSIVLVRDELVSEFRQKLMILLGTAALVLLIVCANVGNLSLTRLLAREREMALRVVLGAAGSRLVRLLLTESLVLALGGGVLGLLLAVAGLQLLISFSRRFTPLADQIGIDVSVLLFAFLVSLLAGLAFGIIPAIQARKTTLVHALQEGGGRATGGASRRRLRGLLIVLQVAVSFVLLIASGLLMRSALKLQQVDPGFKPENVLAMSIDVPFSKYQSRHEVIAFYRTLIEQVGSLPGVRSAGAATNLPLDGSQNTPPIKIEGWVSAPGRPEPRAGFHMASPDYFRTLGIPLLQGRIFTTTDTQQSPSVVVINQSMAHHYWPGQNPIGKRIKTNDLKAPDWSTVIGVVGDVRQAGLDVEAGDAFYLPFLQVGSWETRFFVRTAADPTRLIPEVRNVVHALDPEQPVADVQTLEQVYSGASAPTRLTATLLGLFAVLAFVIMATGLSGVIALSVTERTQEIGIRSALGARPGEVLALVLRQGLALLVAGLAIGAVAALGLGRVLSSLLFGIGPTDPLTFIGISIAMLILVMVACLLPAMRAMRIDPIIALRS